MKSLGIIGTAGRGLDKDLLSIEIWKNICNVSKLTLLNSKCDTIVSGGAAWSDHIAVDLYIEYIDVNSTFHNTFNEITKSSLKLNLFLPVKFDRNRFDENEIKYPFNCGSTLNFYHKSFGNIIKVDTLSQLSICIENGAIINSGKGFHGRNTQIANSSDDLLAFTFGNGCKLKDGGTKDTWDKFMKRKNRGTAYHFNLTENKMYKFQPQLVEEKHGFFE